MSEINCRFFSGYRPCVHSLQNSEVQCSSHCAFRDPVETRILLIHLGALGAVLRSTSLLQAIKRKYPKSHLTWVTDRPADALLLGLKQVDRVVTSSDRDLLGIKGLKFDVVLNVDKSMTSSGIVKLVNAAQVFGFLVDEKTHAIVPATPAANELWQLGLSNEKKFFENKKSETQLVHESLELGEFHRDSYQVSLSSSEIALAETRRFDWMQNKEWVIGLNVGCSPTIPNKKLSISNHRSLIAKLTFKFPNASFVLLGGPEDTKRCFEIASGMDVFISPTQGGLRDGLASVSACDVVITGDSLGMHMAIALKKWTVAWFGPTCEQEIDLFDRGIKVLTKAGCAPCWKRVCDQQSMCYDQVDLAEIIEGVELGFRKIGTTENSLHSDGVHRGSSVVDSDAEVSQS